jgi:hypothetical protein
MHASRIALVALPALLAAASCGAIVGIDDVPVPLGDSGIEATAPMAGGGARGDVTGIDVATEDVRSMGPGGDSRAATSHDATSGSPPDSGGSDSSTEEGGRDSQGADSAALDVAEATVDSSACSAQWNTYDDGCNACGIAHCCAELATCEAPDDAGVNSAGRTHCTALLYCIAGYTGTLPPMHGDPLCKVDDHYLPSEESDADLAIACVRSSCPSACSGL